MTNQLTMANQSVKTVLVTGATGRTGALVFQRLRQLSQDCHPIGFARSQEKAMAQLGTVTDIVIGDITDPDPLTSALQGCHALIIVTSAVPQMVPPATPGDRPTFTFAPGGMPEAVDYHGQRHQIDAARAAGVKHVVLVGSMGGTDENHPLNRLGDGNILMWKRKAEQYLIDSGLDYTIIRAGGLTNDPGGHRPLRVGKHDQFLQENNGPTTVPRADVAEVVVQALREPQARNKAFDLIADSSDGAVEAAATSITTDFAALFSQTTPGL